MYLCNPIVALSPVASFCITRIGSDRTGVDIHDIFQLLFFFFFLVYSGHEIETL